MTPYTTDPITEITEFVILPGTEVSVAHFTHTELFLVCAAPITGRLAYHPLGWIWRPVQQEVTPGLEEFATQTIPKVIEFILGREDWVNSLESWRAAAITKLEESIPQVEAQLLETKALLAGLQKRGIREPGVGAAGQIYDYLAARQNEDQSGRRKEFRQDIL